MANHINYLIKFLFFSSLIAFSFSLLNEEGLKEDDWYEWDYEKNKISIHKDTKQKKKTYAIDFNEGYEKVDLYIKVEVIPDNNEAPPLLCFSTKDHQCLEKDQLVNNPSGKSSILWLQREEFQVDEAELIVVVETEKEDSSYTINFEGYENPIWEPNTVYSYLVGKYNQEIQVIINNILPNKYLTVGLEGSQGIIKVSGVYEESLYEYRNGKVLTFLTAGEDENPFNKSLTVKGLKEGEYVTISVHMIEV